MPNITWSNQQVNILFPVSPQEIHRMVELCEAAGRTCTATVAKTTGDLNWVMARLKQQHMSVAEHYQITVDILTDRKTANQLVRHRHLSVCQESQRYVRYGKGITFIKQPWFVLSCPATRFYIQSCANAYDAYLELLSMGIKPENARDLLPACTATNLIVTANLRTWLELLPKRRNQAAQPMMRALAEMIANSIDELLER